jgi:trigger factor
MVVRQRFGGAVTAEVVEKSMSEAVDGMMRERNLRPAMQPRIDVANEEAMRNIEASPAPDIELKVELELLPDIAVPDFSGIALTRLKAEVPDETMDKALQNIALRNRDYEDIPAETLGDRGAEKGEFVVVDYVGRVNGEEFVGGKGTDVPVEIGGEGFIPGFADQIAGIRPGETRTIHVTFPEDYGSKELAGKQAEFEITAKAIRKAVDPAIDDAFAEKLSFEKLSELKDFIRGQMQREYDAVSRQRLKRDLLDKLNDMVSFDLPPGLVEAEFGQIWSRIEADRQADRLDEEDKGKDEETLRSEYRTIAERRVRLGLLLAEVARQNGVSVSQEELARAMRAEASRYPGQEQQVVEFFRNNPQAVEGLRGPIFEEKAVDFILGKVAVEDRMVTPDELNADPDAPAPAEAKAEAAPATGE